MVTGAYLDNSATTMPCREAVEAVRKCLEEEYYNPSSVYGPAVRAWKDLDAARQDIMRAVSAGGCRLIFTSGGTEANNLAIIGYASRCRKPGIAAVTKVEHPSVSASFEEIRNMGWEVREIGVDMKGAPDWNALEKALDDGAELVSMMQVNNETGVLLDSERLKKLVNGRAVVHVDGVQGFLRVPFDMGCCSMYTVSSHKIHGPKGIGALIVRDGIRLKPRQVGGGQEQGERSGTENTPGIYGFAAAVRAMGPAGEVFGKVMEKKLELIEAFRRKVPELKINGPDPEQAAPHIVNIGFPGVRGEVMLHALERHGVYVSTGSACSSKKLKVSRVLTQMGIPPREAEWAIRISLSPYTTSEEIINAAEAAGVEYGLLKRYQRR